MDSSNEFSFVTAPSQLCAAETQLELGVADEFLAQVSKLEEKLGEIGDQVFTPTQTAEIRTVMSKVEEKLKGTDTLMTAEPQCPAIEVEPRAATAKAISYIAAAMKQMSNAKTVLEGKAAPRTKRPLQTNKELQPRAEIRHSQVAEHHVTKNEIEELAKAISKVSVVPNTRLVIAYPCDNEQYLSEDPLVSIRHEVNGKALHSVIQSPERADHTFTLPGYKRSKIQIIYDPKSNHCHLNWNNGNADVGASEDSPHTILITNLDIMRMRLHYSEEHMLKYTSWENLESSKLFHLRPGCWRILVSSAGKKHPTTVDISLLERPFEVAITNTNEVLPRKREYIDDTEHIRSIKRLKESSSEGTNGIQAASLPDTASYDTVMPRTADNDITWAFQNFATFHIEHKTVIESKATGEDQKTLLSLLVTMLGCLQYI
ncbi:hypothetical protein V8C35DRAFT_321705 [Trichoderma chlorosporum]